LLKGVKYVLDSYFRNEFYKICLLSIINEEHYSLIINKNIKNNFNNSIFNILHKDSFIDIIEQNLKIKLDKSNIIEIIHLFKKSAIKIYDTIEEEENNLYS